MAIITNKTQYADTKYVASSLGVSTATVRNWVKIGHLEPINTKNKKQVFLMQDISNIKAKITSGQLEKLNSRANKKNSKNTFIPDEYAHNTNILKSLDEFVRYYYLHELELNKALLFLSIALLKQVNLINEINSAKIDVMRFQKINVETEIKKWLSELEVKTSDDKYFGILNADYPLECDFIGLIYQSLTSEGKKSQQGSYYTPKFIVDNVIDEHVNKNDLVLDPCCGTGQFLLSAAEKIYDPSKIWGFDIDPLAVKIARINLILKFKNIDFSPNIYNLNTLTEIQTNSLFARVNPPKFDVIITNPPWGAHFLEVESQQLKKLYPRVKSNEIFSYFLVKSHELLKSDGTLSFILPESILNIKTHRDVRELLIKDTTITKIQHLDRVFKNVFTPVIRLDYKKVKPSTKHSFTAEKDGNKYKVPQSNLSGHPDYLLSVFTDSMDANIFEKFYAVKHVTLKDNADWALGIVTGNNKEHISDEKKVGYEPILTGKNIKRYLPSKTKKYICFDSSKFQQVAPVEKYKTQEKLLYKFISKQLVVAYDDKQHLTLNSANILIPKIPNYPVKSILALLNSSPYQFLFQKKFNALRVLKSDIEQFPIPICDRRTHLKLGEFVNNLLLNDLKFEQRMNLYEQLDDFIMGLFKLEDMEKQHILTSINNPNKLLEIN